MTKTTKLTTAASYINAMTRLHMMPRGSVERKELEKACSTFRRTILLPAIKKQK